MKRVLSFLKKHLFQFIISLVFFKLSKVSAITATPDYGVRPMYGIESSPVIVYSKLASLFLSSLAILVSLILGILLLLKKISKKLFLIILGIVWLIAILVYIIVRTISNRFGY